MAKRGKLELTWVGKEDQPRLEPRILVEDPKKSYGDPNAENMLIFGNNLLALKALERNFAGKIKCIYIDPPYNTGSAFEHYDDGLEHSIWLSMMKFRLEILWSLLRDDGLLAVQIDDNEFARLYLLMVEICHERNLKVISVKMAEPTGVKMAQVMKSGGIPKLKEYIILAGKSGVRGLQIERILKETWDEEYKTVIGNVDRSELDRLKEIIEREDRTEKDILSWLTRSAKNFVLIMSKLYADRKLVRILILTGSMRTLGALSGPAPLLAVQRGLLTRNVPVYLTALERLRSRLPRERCM